jgi:hypothetical protein
MKRRAVITALPPIFSMYLVKLPIRSIANQPPTVIYNGLILKPWKNHWFINKVKNAE